MLRNLGIEWGFRVREEEGGTQHSVCWVGGFGQSVGFKTSRGRQAAQNVAKIAIVFSKIPNSNHFLPKIQSEMNNFCSSGQLTSDSNFCKKYGKNRKFVENEQSYYN